MHKHILIELRKILEERIGSLTEEVEIATNVKLNSLYIADRKDEIEFVRWTECLNDCYKIFCSNEQPSTNPSILLNID